MMKKMSLVVGELFLLRLIIKKEHITMSNYSIFISIFCIFVGIINIAVHASEDDSVQESLIGILCVAAGFFGLGTFFPRV